MSLSVRPFVVSTIDSHLSMHSPPHRLVNPQPVLDWLQTIETTSSSRHWTVVNLTRSQLWADKLELRGEILCGGSVQYFMVARHCRRAMVANTISRY